MPSRFAANDTTSHSGSNFEVIEGGKGLAHLAAEINAEHKGVVGAARSGLEHALAAGDLLIEAKSQLNHGEWQPWLKANCKPSKRTAQLYMQIAKNRKLLESKSATVALFTVKAAADELNHMAGEAAIEDGALTTYYAGRGAASAPETERSDPPADKETKPLYESPTVQMLQKLWWRLTEEERRVFLHWARRENKPRRI